MILKLNLYNILIFILILINYINILIKRKNERNIFIIINYYSLLEFAYIVKQELELDAALPKSISVSATLFNYIYTELSIKSLDYIYYHFTDNSYGLANFSYFITKSNIRYDYSILETANYIPLEPSNTKSSDNIKDYYY